MISDEARENGPASTTSVGGRTSAAASGRPLSESPEAKRKREARAAKKNPDASSTGGRGGSEPKSTKGNPGGFDGRLNHMGEPLSAHEAERQLYWGHVGLAKAIRSDIDLEELRPEFQVAGENYAYVANHMWTPLRVVIRFIAPIVLVAVLVVIWGHMLAATPWVGSIRDWWTRRRSEESQQTPPPARPGAQPPADQSAAGAVDATPSEPPAAPPPIPQRPRLVRTMGYRH